MVCISISEWVNNFIVIIFYKGDNPYGIKGKRNHCN